MLVMVKTSMFKRYASMATRAWRIPQLIRNIYTTRVSAVGKNITVPLPLPDKLHDLIYAFRESKVLFAACDLVSSIFFKIPMLRSRSQTCLQRLDPMLMPQLVSWTHWLLWNCWKRLSKMDHGCIQTVT